MKFYVKIKIYNTIFNNNLTAILSSKDCNSIYFFKNSKMHNYKNTAYSDNSGYKEFWLNNKYYGNENNFNKYSWRKFVRGLKLKVFL